ncbi:uncharacterized protein LOC114529594 [Dendronephthya gigantea]|uniref:uncharacterized protein LOC114529594 n=1 Tax=Dendronephthya gigantea TaxID=151771 RepID=UPI00106D9F63|nr:uncharacterized protein LOC114529594 [Dendronephthya gigantea]
MKDVLEFLGQSLIKNNGDINKLNSDLSKYNRILDDIPDKKIYGITSTRIERYYEWQYHVFTPDVDEHPEKQYHVKIVAATGFGNALGLAVNVEVTPGVSKQAADFVSKNRLEYKEPPPAILEASQASVASAALKTTTASMMSRIGTTERQTSGMGMSEAVVPTNEIRPNRVQESENIPVSARTSERNMRESFAALPNNMSPKIVTASESGMIKTSAALPNNWSPKRITVSGTNFIQKSATTMSTIPKASKMKKSKFRKILSGGEARTDQKTWRG